jgi:cold shock CspA family protein
MAQGTVKWFNSQKGYRGRDVFVHISANAPGRMALTKDKRSPSTLLLIEGRARPLAENLRAV